MENIQFEVNKYCSLAYALLSKKFVPSDKERKEQLKQIVKDLDQNSYPGLTSWIDFPSLFSDVSVFSNLTSKEERFDALYSRKEKELEKQNDEESLKQLEKIKDIFLRMYYLLEATMPEYEQHYLKSKEKNFQKIILSWASRKKNIERCLETAQTWSGMTKKDNTILPFRITFQTYPSYGNYGLGYCYDNVMQINIGPSKHIDYDLILHEASHSYTHPNQDKKNWLDTNCKNSWWVRGRTERNTYGRPENIFRESWTRACQIHLYDYLDKKYGIKDEISIGDRIYHTVFKRGSFGCTDLILNEIKRKLPIEDAKGKPIEYTIDDHQNFINTFIENNAELLKAKKLK
ncbi:hypothetical protein ACFLQI_02220 [Candidatus Undinarchaeota archaeon]